MDSGKRETRTALPDDWGIINDEALVRRAVKRWVVSGVMPTKEEMLAADPIWEADLMNARAAMEFLEDAPAVASQVGGAVNVGG